MALILLCGWTTADASAARKTSSSDARLYGGFYLGAEAQRTSVGGDFDGSSFVTGGGSAEILPEIDPASGLSFSLGFRLAQKSGVFIDMEASYDRSAHDGQWMGFAQRSEHTSINLDARMGGGHHVAGFGLLGIGFASTEVPDGSTDGVSVADAKFSGVSIRLGGGLMIPVKKRFAVIVQGVYRLEKYDKDQGISSGSLPASDNVSANGTTLSVGFRVVVSKPR